MKICITGGSGFIGSKLSKKLIDEGHSVLIIDLKEPKNKGNSIEFIKCDLLKEAVPNKILECNAIIHLAGVNIFNKWTNEYKKLILESRIIPAQKILNLTKNSDKGPKIFISASAIGYYGDRGEKELTENSPNGNDFLAEVCEQWEEVSAKSKDNGMRWISVRTGIVLGPDGGIISKLKPIFKNFIGGPIGNGKQWFSWIYIDDLLNIYTEALTNDSLKGPINAVSPNPIRNKEFSNMFGRTLKKPSLIPVPKFVLKIVFGELANVLIASQKVLPNKLKEIDFKFINPDIKDALRKSLIK